MNVLFSSRRGATVQSYSLLTSKQCFPGLFSNATASRSQSLALGRSSFVSLHKSGRHVGMNMQATLSVRLFRTNGLVMSRPPSAFHNIFVKSLSSSVHKPFQSACNFQAGRCFSTTNNVNLVNTRAERMIRYWLYGCAGMVFTMVVVGGVTRLTESGLSIVKWQPISGIRPPLSTQEWEEEFESYKQYPEYQKLNPNMTLDEFKKIFWMEWAHRFLGRVIGLAYGIPLIYFIRKGYLTGRLRTQLLAILFGIGVEGGLGWFMVKSGLEEVQGTPPRVSQYRLAAHLGTAFTIYSGMLWSAMSIGQNSSQSNQNALLKNNIPTSQIIRRNPLFLRASVAVTAIVFTTALSGAFVAGLDAGLIYNEFPLMGGRLVPEEYSDLKPLWRNLFENDAAVQFNHRVLGTSSLLAVTALWFTSRRIQLPPRAKLVMNCLMGMAGLQVSLGIATLLSFVHTHVAATHQAGSLTLLSISLWLLRELRKLPK